MTLDHWFIMGVAWLALLLALGASALWMRTIDDRFLSTEVKQRQK